MKNKIYYEARLNRNIRKENYCTTIYKKGRVISTFSESYFKKLTKKNINNYFSPQVVVGHGNLDYFDIEKDIQWVRVEKIIKTKEKKVKLK